jgi:hypothetical protein
MELALTLYTATSDYDGLSSGDRYIVDRLIALLRENLSKSQIELLEMKERAGKLKRQIADDEKHTAQAEKDAAWERFKCGFIPGSSEPMHCNVM